MSRDPVTCDECGKAISRKGDLARHMQSHAPNKEELMHRCPYTGCNYKTLQRSNLKTHENSHTGKKPHMCPTCCFRCSDPGSLSRHRKEIHGYVTKYRTRSQPTAGRAKRRQGKKSSSNSSSSNPGEESGSSGLPIEPPSESYKTPRLAPKMLDLCSSPIPPAECCVKDGVKCSSVAFKTLLTTEHSEVNDGRPLPNAEVESSSLDLPAEPVPWMTPNEATDNTFDNFLAQWDGSQAEIVPMAQLTLPAVSLLPVVNNDGYTPNDTIAQPYLYTGHNNYALESPAPYVDPVAVPSYGGCADDAGYDLYGYAANEALFSEQFSQGYMFGDPDMGLYSQGVDEAHQYPTAGPSDFPTQGSYYH